MPVRSWLVGRARAVVVACAAVVVLALATGCEMRVEVAVDVESGGAGSVVVSVGFDDAAVERLGDPAEALALDDLVAVGWSLEPIERNDEGVTWVRMSRTFDDPAGFSAVLDEVAGAGGPLTGSSVSVERGLVNTTTALVGVVDLSAGLAPFADADLTTATGGVAFRRAHRRGGGRRTTTGGRHGAGDGVVDRGGRLGGGHAPSGRPPGGGGTQPAGPAVAMDGAARCGAGRCCWGRPHGGGGAAPQKPPDRLSVAPGS